MFQMFFVLSCFILFDPMLSHCLSTEIKCQSFKSKTKPASLLVLKCAVCVLIETPVCEWVVCFPSSGDTWCANFKLSLPPQLVSFTDNKHYLWRKLHIVSQFTADAKLSSSLQTLRLIYSDICGSAN